jgi:hypothetical protein
VLSGFTTHLGFAASDLPTEGLSAYFGRFDRVVLSTVVSMLVTLLPFGHIDMSSKTHTPAGGNTTHNTTLPAYRLGGDIDPDFGHQALCVLTLGAVSSFDPGHMCRNLAVWFIGGMMPIWLAYPWLARGVRTINTQCGQWGLLVMALALWTLCSFLPMWVLAELRYACPVS